MFGPSTLFSHSRLQTFERCPRRFHYRYVRELPPEGESVEAFLGKRVHEVLERLYRAVGRGHLPSLEQVRSRYRQLFDDAYDARRVRIVRRENRIDDYRRLGERCLAGFYRSHYPFDREETLGVEERVVFRLAGRAGYRVQGVVDRIARARDGAIEIHDYKTSARVPSQKEIDADRQLALYQIGVVDRLGSAPPIRLVWHFLQSGRRRTSTRSPEQLAQLTRETIDLIDRVRAERRFEARPSRLCGWCEYRDRCPASPQRLAHLPGYGEPDATRPPSAQARAVPRRRSRPARELGAIQLALL